MMASLVETTHQIVALVDVGADFHMYGPYHASMSRFPFILLAGAALAVAAVFLLVLLRKQLFRALMVLGLGAMLIIPAALMMRPASLHSYARIARSRALDFSHDGREVMAKVRSEIGEAVESIRETAGSIAAVELSAPEVSTLMRIDVPRSAAPRYGKSGNSWAKRILSFGAVGLFIFLTYLFLDSGTRGHFTWPLRILTIIAFVGICVTIAMVGGLS